MNENAIRDYLSERLDLIEPGMTLVDCEHYLKNPKGASGFLDIFAQSANGQLVIIEIKRTDSAAREALQELFKYAALIRQRYLIRDTDYRLIILSAKWHELLTPYSEFVKHAPYEISAGTIIFDDEGIPCRIEPVESIETAAQRRISKRHFLWRFDSRQTLEAALPILSAHMKNVGLEDFVFIQSQPYDSRISNKHFLYFAQQELSLNEYKLLIHAKVDTLEYQEYLENISDLVEEEDRIGESADQVWLPDYDNTYRKINSDTSEISNPEKAANWFSEGRQKTIKVHRFGRFNDNNISEDTIIAEIIGQCGISDYLLELDASLESKPQIDAMISAIENIFYFNNDWRGAAKDLIGYAQRTGAKSVSIAAFSNEDILRSIAGCAFGFTAFVPSLIFDVHRVDGEIERFIGIPEWDGTKPDFTHLLDSYFGGENCDYFMAHHFGEHRIVNADIMNELGLHYSVFRQYGEEAKKVRIQGASIAVSPLKLKGSIPSLIHENIEEVHKIVGHFMNHDNGFAQIIHDWVRAQNTFKSN